MEECLSKRLKEKTRVLVTHKLESLRYVDYIYIFKSGKILSQGDFQTIKKTQYYQEMEEQANKQANEQGIHEITEPEIPNEDLKESSKENQKDKKESTGQQAKRKETSFHEGEEQKKMFEKLMLTEDRQTGAVSLTIWKVFFQYFGSGKNLILLLSGTIISDKTYFYSYCAMDII